MSNLIKQIKGPKQPKSRNRNIKTLSNSPLSNEIKFCHFQNMNKNPESKNSAKMKNLSFCENNNQKQLQENLIQYRQHRKNYSVDRSKKIDQLLLEQTNNKMIRNIHKPRTDSFTRLTQSNNDVESCNEKPESQRNANVPYTIQIQNKKKNTENEKINRGLKIQYIQ